MKLPNIFEQQTPSVAFPAGATIFTAGETGDSMYFVRSGEVDLRVGAHTVEIVGPDGWFGEMALIEEGVRSADAVARTDCTLAPINEKQFLFMVGETPFFALQILRTLSRRLRRVNAEHH
jgi:CRP-like cAMP-binding protein